jgi:hypothetical protein
MGGGQQISWHLTAQAKGKAAHGHVVYTVQEAPFWAPFDAVFDTSCPGNERCAVKSLPVRCLFRLVRPMALMVTLTKSKFEQIELVRSSKKFEAHNTKNWCYYCRM